MFWKEPGSLMLFVQQILESQAKSREASEWGNRFPLVPRGMGEVRGRSGGGVYSLELSQDAEIAAYGLSVCVKFPKEK